MTENWTGTEKKKMQIRRLQIKEHGRTRKLYETVFFQDEKRFVDYYYTWKTGKNQIYAAEDPAGIHAMLHLNPVEICWNEKIQTIFYIVAVATEEKYRHQGLMRRLLKRSLQDLYEQQAPFVFLMPAAEAIYTPFGFRRAWEWRWEEEAAAAGGEAKAWYPLEQCSEQQLEELSSRVNKTLGEQFELFALRSPEYYRNLNREQQACGGCAEVLFETQKAMADGSGTNPAEGPMCQEGELAKEKGQGVCVRCTAKEAFTPMMARIIHLEHFLKQVKTKEESDFFWKVEDELLPENSGCFAVHLSPDGGRVRRLEPEEESRCTAVSIAQIPELLADANPFHRAMICEVV